MRITNVTFTIIMTLVTTSALCQQPADTDQRIRALRLYEDLTARGQWVEATRLYETDLSRLCSDRQSLTLGYQLYLEVGNNRKALEMSNRLQDFLPPVTEKPNGYRAGEDCMNLVLRKYADRQEIDWSAYREKYPDAFVPRELRMEAERALEGFCFVRYQYLLDELIVQGGSKRVLDALAERYARKQEERRKLNAPPV